MKIEKNLIEKIANEKTCLRGEAVAIARKIIENKLQSQFKKFAFFYQGDGNEIYDVQDCILDFRLFDAEINVLDINSGKSIIKIPGKTIEESLRKLFETSVDYYNLNKDLDGKLFTVNGIDGKFKICSVAFHYCFVKNRMSEEECLEMMRI